MSRRTLCLVLILGVGLVMITSASPTLKVVTLLVLSITLAYEFVRSLQQRA
ncbi:MAG: hypothetical protein QW267_00005 [Sulfolobales archaeon]